MKYQLPLLKFEITMRRIGLLAFLTLCLMEKPQAQPLPQTQDPVIGRSLDSLKRAITRRILSEADKKAIRSCDREKSQFLRQCRSADTAHANVDQKIRDAKMREANPNDPAIMALMERKFKLEKACDDKFLALPRGRQCLAGEGKRRKALEKALREDKPYQALLKKLETSQSEI